MVTDRILLWTLVGLFLLLFLACVVLADSAGNPPPVFAAGLGSIVGAILALGRPKGGQ